MRREGEGSDGEVETPPVCTGDKEGRVIIYWLDLFIQKEV